MENCGKALVIRLCRVNDCRHLVGFEFPNNRGKYYVIKLMLCELSSSGGIFTNFNFVVT